MEKKCKISLFLSFFVLFVITNFGSSLKVYRCSLCEHWKRSDNCYTKQAFTFSKPTRNKTIATPRPIDCSITYEPYQNDNRIVINFTYPGSNKLRKPKFFRLLYFIDWYDYHYQIYPPESYKYWQEDAQFIVDDCTTLRQTLKHEVQISTVPYLLNREGMPKYCRSRINTPFYELRKYKKIKNRKNEDILFK